MERIDTLLIPISQIRNEAVKQHVQHLTDLIRDQSIPESRRRVYASKLMMANYYVMIYEQGADINTEILACNDIGDELLPEERELNAEEICGQIGIDIEKFI